MKKLFFTVAMSVLLGFSASANAAVIGFDDIDQVLTGILIFMIMRGFTGKMLLL